MYIICFLWHSRYIVITFILTSFFLRERKEAKKARRFLPTAGRQNLQEW